MGIRLRDELYSKACQQAFGQLEPWEQELIDAMVQKLGDRLRNFGPLAALELISKLGIWDACREKALHEMLETVDQAEDRAWELYQPTILPLMERVTS